MSIFVLMAGGTGGHLFPAQALAQELRRRGHEIHLMTDHRVTAYGGDFPAREVHVVPSATPSIRNPVRFFFAGVTILWGIVVAMAKLRGIKPDAVVGFGGYPVFPPFVAASLLGIPGVLHEQNAVMGRANRALARFARVIAASFEETKFAESYTQKTVRTGNPVRDVVRELAQTENYAAPTDDGPLRLLVFGGSQGARVFADLVPLAVAELPRDIVKHLTIVQQCRPEDLDRVAMAYDGMQVDADLKAFFDDLPSQIVGSHLVICRSGASTVAELAALGVPAIMIPLPGALDADQKANAGFLADAGGGWLMEQATVSPQSLGKRLGDLFGASGVLAEAAKRAKSLGQPDAVIRLAELVERTAAKAPVIAGDR